ncbi:hypothetical protein N7539_007553 [Penicillium diatomitis]|uniref:Uncharacterized protein n=1 Tax=Penicillium diatomitis TaxID=2819901 RepID=A0A9X0BNY6_9EURO|nr:uncharacterized protein N7539_007553 [Penicillium diatomitis]KAJ5477409.1 hypothetical protein N7539_007553 [Penicillium diatomitis]
MQSPGTPYKRRPVSVTPVSSPKRPKLERATSASPFQTMTQTLARTASILYAGSTEVTRDPLQECQTALANDIQSLRWDDSRETAANQRGFEMLQFLRELKAEVETLKHNVKTLEGKNKTLEGNVKTLEGKNKTLEGHKSQSDARIQALEAQTKALGEHDTIRAAETKICRDVRLRTILSYCRPRLNKVEKTPVEQEICDMVTDQTKVHAGNVLGDASALLENFPDPADEFQHTAYRSFQKLYGTTPQRIRAADLARIPESIRTLDTIATHMYARKGRHRLTEEAFQSRQALIQLLDSREYESAEAFCLENRLFFAPREKNQESKLLEGVSEDEPDDWTY